MHMHMHMRMCMYQIPACCTYRRHRAACPGRPLLYVRRARTSLWRAARTAYRGTAGLHWEWGDNQRTVARQAEAIRSIRALPALHKYPVAVLSDGGGPTHEWVWEHLRPDIVQPLLPDVNAEMDDHGDDVRGRKLMAYTQSPFERTVFLDGDTFVRSVRVEMLFEALDRFELAAAFECCRVDWSSSATPFDGGGFFRGWEMQTGVMAQRRSPAVAQFWRTAAEIYRSRREFWAKRSSAEQGAATLALAQSPVRFLPLPPAFNARPFTMYHWLKAFGMPVYHGKDLWTHKGLDGEPAEPEGMIRQRMARDWTKALELVKTFQSP